VTAINEPTRIDTERQQIRDAAQRLLEGKPIRSNGKPTVSTLAHEAAVPRQRLYEHHADLIDEFKTSAVGGPTPPDLQALQQQLADALTRITDLETDNNLLQKRIRTLSAVIAELTHETKGGNVIALPRTRPHTTE
jgi:hypothetical protein